MAKTSTKKDLNQVAKLVSDIATGQFLDVKTDIKPTKKKAKKKS